MTFEAEKVAYIKLLKGLWGSRTRTAVSSAVEKAPKSFAKSISEADVEKAWAGYKHHGSTGTDSLVASLPAWAAGKVVGKDKVNNFFWKAVHKPALTADTAAGHALGKIPGAKKLFTTTERIPWGNPADKLHKEVERSSALAPLSKIKDVAAPIIVGVGLDKGVSKISDLAKARRKEKQMHDQGMREKVASTMLRLHEENKEHTKRAHATRLLFKKAELGLEQIPHTYHELQEKIASLENQDLVVLEKALELTGGQFKLGELDVSRTAGINATEKFQAAVLGDEL